MTEQFTFDERLGNRRTIDRHKRAIRSGALQMNGPCDQFLSRSILTTDENTAVRRPGGFDELPKLLHRLGLPDQFGLLFHLGPQGAILLLQSILI